VNLRSDVPQLDGNVDAECTDTTAIASEVLPPGATDSDQY